MLIFMRHRLKKNWNIGGSLIGPYNRTINSSLIGLLIFTNCDLSEAYLVPCQTFEMGIFCKLFIASRYCLRKKTPTQIFYPNNCKYTFLIVKSHRRTVSQGIPYKAEPEPTPQKKMALDLQRQRSLSQNSTGSHITVFFNDVRF